MIPRHFHAIFIYFSSSFANSALPNPMTIYESTGHGSVNIQFCDCSGDDFDLVEGRAYVVDTPFPF
jgi:hypothetical protein